MVHFLDSFTRLSRLPEPPQRRRVVIIGAGATGMAAAFHLGEHSVLLERRPTLEDSNDHSNDFPLGASSGGVLGGEDTAADGQRSGLSFAERKALFITCSSTGEGSSDGHTLIHVFRWQPPEFAPCLDEGSVAPEVRALVPLLRGELRLNTCVVRISTSQRLLELADGTRIVYDKLLCTQSLASLACLVAHELPGRVRRDESLRHWLQQSDIEVSDRATQVSYGDVDEFAAGMRMADRIGEALAVKFRKVGHARSHDTRLFQPRLVQAPAAPAIG